MSTSPSNTAPNAGARCVLIVDDYPRVLEWVARAFARGGWRVLTASDGGEALDCWTREHADGGRVDLLLTDLDLPVVSGVDLALKLRAEQPHLPAMGITGFHHLEESWTSAVQEPVGFLRKPVRSVQLLALADQLVPAGRAAPAQHA